MIRGAVRPEIIELYLVGRDAGKLISGYGGMVGDDNGRLAAA